MKSPALILDASPIICLAKAQLAFLLPKITSEVCLPVSVLQEIEQGPEEDPARAWVRDQNLRIIAVNEISSDVSKLQLGSGESAVIQLGLNRKGDCILVLDDLRARSAAATFGLSCHGSVGLLLVAKERGLIASVSGALQSLISVGLRIHPDLFKAAIGLAGET